MVPDAETSAQMYQMAITALADCGLKQYEISAFAKNGLFSKHNVGYWTGRPFLGFGPSAFSYWDHKRFRSVANLKRYCENLEKNLSPIDFSEELQRKARRNELLAIGLRLRSGVDLDVFEKLHGELCTETMGALNSLVNDKFLEMQGAILPLRIKGCYFMTQLPLSWFKLGYDS